MALFSNRKSNTSFLVEFRAGKMTLRGSTVFPDKRKGLVYVNQSHDSLMHFCWKDRSSGVVEDDLILFPDEVEFVSVPMCTTGRVYMLKFKNSSRKLFFWMQEPKSDKDEEYCRKVNELLNTPPSANSAVRKGNGRNSSTDLNEHLAMMNQLFNIGPRRDESGSSGSSDWHGASLPTMNQSQLMELLDLMGNNSNQLVEISDQDQLFQSGNAAANSNSSAVKGQEKLALSAPGTEVINNNSVDAVASSESAPVASGGKVEANTSASDEEKAGKIALSDLRSVLASLSARTKTKADLPANLKFEKIFTVDRLQGSISKEENVKKLVAHLPSQPELNDKQRLLEHLRCPQFKQSLRLFSEALQSGHLGQLMKQFSFPNDVIEACNSGDVLSVALSIEEAVQRGDREQSGTQQQSQTKNTEPAKKKKRDIDSDMELD